ncbi:MAG: ribonuclease Z, partial [Actinocrinis sp.]
WPQTAERLLRERAAAGERDELAEDEPFGRLTAVRLDHGIDAYGYRITEPDGRRMLPAKLAAAGLRGPIVGELRQRGAVVHEGRTVTLDQVSAAKPGQSAAFVMDTRLCDGVYELADHADLLVIESTFLEADARLAREYGHLTAGQAARVAAESGVRTLVLTHFSRRYPDPSAFYREARDQFDGELRIAEDLMRVPVPRRVEATEG